LILFPFFFLPILGTASGVIPALGTRRSFCFLRRHPKNLFASLTKIQICHLNHRLAAAGTIVWPEQIGSALFSIGGFHVKSAIGSIHWPKVQNRKHRVAKSANSPHGKILRSYPLTVCFWALRWPFDLKRGFSTQKPPNSTTANGKHPLAKPKRKHPPAKTAKRWFKSQNSFGPP
jgi:hypothetical protein